MSEAVEKFFGQVDGWVGVPSSQGSCTCPEEALDPKCPRHQYLTDCLHSMPWKDHFEDYWKYMAHKRIADIANHSMRYLAEVILPEQPYEWIPRIQPGDLVGFEIEGEVFTDVFDDTMLAYMRSVPPRQPAASYVPPKWNTKAYWRVRKNRLNHAVQQWIHDHLTDAYCDS